MSARNHVRFLMIGSALSCEKPGAVQRRHGLRFVYLVADPDEVVFAAAFQCQVGFEKLKSGHGQKNADK